MSQLHVPVAIATCSQVLGKQKEDLQVIDALRRRGIEAAHVAWDDARVHWSSFALVVIRSTWDYPQRREEFLAWARQLRTVLNPFPILKWNTDKRYLHDLARAGLPVITTRYLEPGDVFESPSWSFVVKPAVSCDAKDTARYDADDGARAYDHVRRLQASGRTVMVQPYLSDIEEKGEVAVMYLGGSYSHSICRRALLKQAGLPKESAGMPLDFRAYEATLAERWLADRVMTHIPGGSCGLLYGRVDLIPGLGGETMILEVELTEPSLFLEFSTGGVERLTDCIASALTTKALSQP
jgi:glutathione synthase/RimK-type ligase-like ATP-grasp enzyme